MVDTILPVRRSAAQVLKREQLLVLGGIRGRLLRREYLLSLLPALGDYHLLGLLVEILADLGMRGGVGCRSLLG